MRHVTGKLEVDFNNIDKHGRVRVPRDQQGELSYGDVARLRDSLDDMEVFGVLQGSTV
jgi:hypothetical protein